MIARRSERSHFRPARRPAARAGQTGAGCLTRAELAEFRERLVAKRRSVVDDIRAMETAGASDAPELLESEWRLVGEIDDALGRIDNGTYGVCEATGARITNARLRACPWARHCIEYARRNQSARAPATGPQRWPEDDAQERPAPDPWELLRRD